MLWLTCGRSQEKWMTSTMKTGKQNSTKFFCKLVRIRVWVESTRKPLTKGCSHPLTWSPLQTSTAPSWVTMWTQWYRPGRGQGLLLCGQAGHKAPPELSSPENKNLRPMGVGGDRAANSVSYRALQWEKETVNNLYRGNGHSPQPEKESVNLKVGH